MAARKPLVVIGGVTQEIPSGDVVAAASGGTGLSTYAIGDLIYASGVLALSKLADVATGNALISGGVNTAPSWGKITSSHVDSSIMLSGTVPTAIVVANESTDTTCFPLFATAASGSLAPKTNANLTYNSSSGIFTATGLYAVKASNPSVRVANDLSGTSKELLLGIYTGSGVVSLEGFDYNTTAYLPIYFNDGTVNISAAGVLTAFSFVGPLTGNASTATALQTTRTIGGSNFNGSANVTSFPTPGAIGGTTPSTIAATSLACPTFTSSAAMGFTPAAGSGVNFNLSGVGDFAVNTNQLYVDTSTGNVGIGTTAPVVKFHVQGTDTDGELVRFRRGVGATNNPALSFIFTEAGTVSTIRASGSTGGQLAFETIGTERMRIDASGNVGIGTPSPGARMDVVENIRISRVTSGNNMDLDFYSPQGYPGVVAKVRVDGDGTANYFGALSFWTGRLDTGSLTERMRIMNNGNVGIGITAPTALLHLGASTTARASLCIPSGTAPTSPVAGDIWYDGTNLKFRDGGTTRTLTWV